MVDEDSFLAAPVRDFMSTPPIHVTPTSSVHDAVKTLLEYEISGMPVTDNDRVVGVISGLDVLREVARALVEITPLEAKLAKSLIEDPLQKTLAEKLVDNYLSLFRRMLRVHGLKIDVKESAKASKTEGWRRYSVKVKLVSNEGVFIAEGLGWDALTALRVR